MSEHWYRPGFIWPIKVGFLTASALLIGLGIWGAFLARLDIDHWSPTLGVLAALLLLHLPIMAQPRLGAPLIPLWAILASISINELLRKCAAATFAAQTSTKQMA